jgi:hypothetical protein
VLAKRRPLMTAWANFINGVETERVVQLAR